MAITATSIPSCSSAPDTGGNSPTAATPIARKESPMPTRMLCRAIPRERRPIATASTTRSIRSTKMMTSAVAQIREYLAFYPDRVDAIDVGAER